VVVVVAPGGEQARDLGHRGEELDIYVLEATRRAITSSSTVTLPEDLT